MVANVLLLRLDHPNSASLRRLKSLCSSKTVTVPAAYLKMVVDSMKPDFKSLATNEELAGWIRQFLANRFHMNQEDPFGSNLVFYRFSMLNHDHAPNCAFSCWEEEDHVQRKLMASRVIKKGEELTLSYLADALCYNPSYVLQQSLSEWYDVAKGWTGPETTRCFVCPACKSTSMCPPEADYLKPLPPKNLHECKKDAGKKDSNTDGVDRVEDGKSTEAGTEADTAETTELSEATVDSKVDDSDKSTQDSKTGEDNTNQEKARDQNAPPPFRMLTCVDCGHTACADYIKLCLEKEKDHTWLIHQFPEVDSGGCAPLSKHHYVVINLAKYMIDEFFGGDHNLALRMQPVRFYFMSLNFLAADFEMFRTAFKFSILTKSVGSVGSEVADRSW